MSPAEPGGEPEGPAGPTGRRPLAPRPLVPASPLRLPPGMGAASTWGPISCLHVLNEGHFHGNKEKTKEAKKPVARGQRFRKTSGCWGAGRDGSLR